MTLDHYLFQDYDYEFRNENFADFMEQIYFKNKKVMSSPFFIFWGIIALLSLSAKLVNSLTAIAPPKRKPAMGKVCNGVVLLSDFINIVL